MIRKSRDSVGFVVDWLWACSQFTLTPGVRSVYWITLGTGLPDFSHAPTEPRWEGCTCACFSFGTWGQPASPPPSCCDAQEAESGTPPMLPHLSAWGTGSSISHLLPALGIACVSPWLLCEEIKLSKALDWEFRKLFFPGAWLQALMGSWVDLVSFCVCPLPVLWRMLWPFKWEHAWPCEVQCVVDL